MLIEIYFGLAMFNGYLILINITQIENDIDQIQNDITLALNNTRVTTHHHHLI